MPVYLLIPLAVFAIAGGLYGLHRLLLWMERKDWIYYRRTRPMQGVRGTMGIFHQIVEPEIRYVIEAKDQQRAEIDEQDPSDR